MAVLWVKTGLAKCCRAGGSCRLDLHCLKDRPYSPSRRALHAHTLPHWAGVHQPIRNKPARRSKTNEPLDNPDLRPRHVGKWAGSIWPLPPAATIARPVSLVAFVGVLVPAHGRQMTTQRAQPRLQS